MCCAALSPPVTQVFCFQSTVYQAGPALCWCFHSSYQLQPHAQPPPTVFHRPSLCLQPPSTRPPPQPPARTYTYTRNPQSPAPPAPVCAHQPPPPPPEPHTP